MAEQDWVNGSEDGSESAFKELRAASPPTAQYELRPLTTGEILDRTFFLYRSRFWLYVGLASVAAGVSVLASIGKLAYFHYRTIA